MIKSHKHAPIHVQVAFIKLKQAIDNKFVQLREFGASDTCMKRQKKRFSIRTWLNSTLNHENATKNS